MAETLHSWLQELIQVDREAGVINGDTAQLRETALGQMLGNHRSMNVSQFREAMTTAHFHDYFSTALSRMFYADYTRQRGAWRNYTYADTTPDFRNVERFRMSEPGTLYLRREKAEAKATDIQETMLQYRVREYARQFDVSWQAILNDDLGKIRETPRRMANAATAFEDAYVSSLYDNATTQATLAALGAPWAGTGRLTSANLAIGVAAMMRRTDAAGNPIQINRLYLVIPPILTVQAATILQSLQVAGVATNDINVIPQFIGQVFVDPYIATAGANVPWYLFADPAEIPSVTVARLQGAEQPWVAKKISDMEMVIGTAPAAFAMGSFATGDIEYQVEDIIGGWEDASYRGVTDFRGIYYSSGTTP